MIRGEAVSVELLDATARDRMGNEVEAYEDPVEVTVVVAPKSAEGLDGNHPTGAHSELTLHFPRTWDGDLRGARVTVRGRAYKVVGDPQPYTSGNVRGPWSMPVTVERDDG